MRTDRIRAAIHAGMERGFTPLARGLAGLGVTPNHVTVVGTLLQLASAGMVAHGALFWGGALYLAAASLDTLDGTLARVAGQASARGAFLDSTLDRVAESAMFAALAYRFAADGQPLDAALAVVALAVSMLVSYMRARAEALGLASSDGLATRSERVIVVGAGLILGWPALATYIVAATAAITVGQRLAAIWRALGKT